jgi:hypothetical protein
LQAETGSRRREHARGGVASQRCSTSDELPDDAACQTNARSSFVAVVSLALEKHLFLNAARRRPVVSLCGKKLCDINKRLDPF